MSNISAIVLTYNEERHIERCIKSLLQITNKIFVIDSFSSDNTTKIASGMGATVLYNRWENNYSKQFNWALKNALIGTDWIIRIDADEYLSDKLIYEINSKLNNLSNNIAGIELTLDRYFLGRKIRYGVGNIRQIRIFRKDRAICEPRMMDEHIMVDGDIIRFKGHWIDNNLSTIQEWTSKHNYYAIRETIDYLNLYPDNDINNEYSYSYNAFNKHKKKERYGKMPLFFRAFIYFCIRYFLRGGFLDGKEGFLWHFLQGWWYRTLVDAKIFEIKSKCGNNKDKIKEYIKANYNIDL